MGAVTHSNLLMGVCMTIYKNCFAQMKQHKKQKKIVYIYNKDWLIHVENYFVFNL